ATAHADDAGSISKAHASPRAHGLKAGLRYGTSCSRSDMMTPIPCQSRTQDQWWHRWCVQCGRRGKASDAWPLRILVAGWETAALTDLAAPGSSSRLAGEGRRNCLDCGEPPLNAGLSPKVGTPLNGRLQ